MPATIEHVQSRVEGLEDRLSELKIEVHGLTVRADQREERHNERHAELKGQLKELADGFARAQRETASFNRELLEAVRSGRASPQDPPPPPALGAFSPRPTVVEQLNALDWRIVIAIVVCVGLVSGSVTAPMLERWLFPAVSVAAPAGAGQ